jgi:hypothetical protein
VELFDISFSLAVRSPAQLVPGKPTTSVVFVNANPFLRSKLTPKRPFCQRTPGVATNWQKRHTDLDLIARIG